MSQDLTDFELEQITEAQTREERDRAREERLSELEDFIGKVFEGVKTVGIVEAGPHEGLYRVTSDGKTVLVPIAPADVIEIPILPKIGNSVVVCNNSILYVLPEELHVKTEPIEFTHVDWSEIGGMKSQIQSIRDAVEIPLLYPHIYKEFNQPIMKGVVLSGPPGVGKTMIAKGIASFVLKDVPKDQIEPESFIYKKGGEMLSKYVGEAEGNIVELFESTRRYYKKTGKRSVVFIDEAEAILPKRGSRVSSDVDTTIVPTFLAEMDGFAEGGPFIILATNFYKQLDPAVVRAGRIDLKIELKRPTMEDSVEIFRIHFSKTKVEDLDIITKVAVEQLWKIPDIEKIISGAYIADVVKKAVNTAIKRNITTAKGPLYVTTGDLISTMATLKAV